ncbi:MAG TPA: amidase [Candidatus Lokiarchaeia archaeon]|nr:amidase [Candidatus Lokiarchaeia archaeon]
MTRDEICFLPATEMLDRISRQDVPSSEIVEAIIERIEKINPIVNAYCTPTFDLAREQARQADERVEHNEDKIPLLNGVPVSIKDMFNVAGVRTTWGSLIEANNIPMEDDVPTSRLRAAGCAFLGKTNMCEFGALGVTKNLIFGETKNPWNLDRTCGGSSGGAGVAVAAGLGPLALGADGGGSIRHPATMCGVVGFKATLGRVPYWPRRGMAGDTTTHVGPLTRTVTDAALMLDALKGNHLMDRYSLPDDPVSYASNVNKHPDHLVIGFTTDFGNVKAIEPEVEHAFLDSVEKLEQFGWDVHPAIVKVKSPEDSFSIIYPSLFAYDLKSKLKEWADKMDPDVVRLVGGEWFSAFDFIKALDRQRKFYDAMLAHFKEFDLLATPTIATTAFELGKMFPMEINGIKISPTGWMPYTYPFNMTGQPAITVPCGFDRDGLPIGMQIIGKRFDDLIVLQAAHAFEEAAPWHDKRPSL